MLALLASADMRRIEGCCAAASTCAGFSAAADPGLGSPQAAHTSASALFLTSHAGHSHVLAFILAARAAKLVAGAADGAAGGGGGGEGVAAVASAAAAAGVVEAMGGVARGGEGEGGAAAVPVVVVG